MEPILSSVGMRGPGYSYSFGDRTETGTGTGTVRQYFDDTTGCNSQQSYEMPFFLSFLLSFFTVSYIVR